MPPAGAGGGGLNVCGQLSSDVITPSPSTSAHPGSAASVSRSIGGVTFGGGGSLLMPSMQSAGLYSESSGTTRSFVSLRSISLQ